jgi:hypothetical protein
MINAKLLDALVTVDFPDDDYKSWVIRTRKIAARLEARSGYVISRNVATWFIKKRIQCLLFEAPDRQTQPEAAQHTDDKFGWRYSNNGN